jgi:hypothetical protein
MRSALQKLPSTSICLLVIFVSRLGAWGARRDALASSFLRPRSQGPTSICNEICNEVLHRPLFRGFTPPIPGGKSPLKIAVFYLRAICCNRSCGAWKASRRSTSRHSKRQCPCISTGERHSLASLDQAMSLVEPERSLDTDGSRQPW